MQPSPRAETSRSPRLRFSISCQAFRSGKLSDPRYASARASPLRGGEGPLELVEAAVPAPMLGVAALVGRDAAVDHHDRRRAVGLRKPELDQLLLVGRIVAEGPGHGEPVRPVDLRVLATGLDLGTIR